MWERIEALLKARNMTVLQLSRVTDIKPTTIYTWKAGKVTPAANKLAKIADYFDVSVNYLLGKEEKPAEEVMLERKLREFREENEKLYALCLKISALNEADRKAVEHIVNSLSNK